MGSARSPPGLRSPRSVMRLRHRGGRRLFRGAVRREAEPWGHRDGRQCTDLCSPGGLCAPCRRLRLRLPLAAAERALCPGACSPCCRPVASDATSGRWTEHGGAWASSAASAHGASGHLSSPLVPEAWSCPRSHLAGPAERTLVEMAQWWGRSPVRRPCDSQMSPGWGREERDGTAYLAPGGLPTGQTVAVAIVPRQGLRGEARAWCDVKWAEIRGQGPGMVSVSPRAAWGATRSTSTSASSRMGA